MGIIDGKFLRGTVGSSVFKKYRDKQVVQGKTKKHKIDMTVATFDAAYVFGLASTLAATIRDLNDPLIKYHDGRMISRFTGECNQVLQQASSNGGNTFHFDQESFSRLNGFEFHADALVKNHFFVQPVCSFTNHEIKVDLPEMQIPDELKFPARAKYCILAFNVCLFDLENGSYQRQEIQSVQVELQHPGNLIPASSFTFDGAARCLGIISLGLFYLEKTFAGNTVMNNEKFSPSAVLKAAFCPGEPVTQHNWEKIQFQEKKKRRFKKN